MSHFKLCWSFCLACLVLPAALPAGEDKAGEKPAGTITIVITDDGPKAKYIKAGDKVQKPVVVRVGQTVIWENTDDEDHTATSKIKKGEKPLFDTGIIGSKKSGKVVFDQKLFESAGGKPGGEVKLEYFCTLHKPMKSAIIFKSAQAKKKE